MRDSGAAANTRNRPVGGERPVEVHQKYGASHRLCASAVLPTRNSQIGIRSVCRFGTNFDSLQQQNP